MAKRSAPVRKVDNFSCRLLSYSEQYMHYNWVIMEGVYAEVVARLWKTSEDYEDDSIFNPVKETQRTVR